MSENGGNSRLIGLNRPGFSLVMFKSLFKYSFGNVVVSKYELLLFESNFKSLKMII